MTYLRSGDNLVFPLCRRALQTCASQIFRCPQISWRSCKMQVLNEHVWSGASSVSLTGSQRNARLLACGSHLEFQEGIFGGINNFLNEWTTVKKTHQIKHIVKLCSTLFLTPSFKKTKKNTQKTQVIYISIQSVCYPSSHYSFYSLSISPHFNFIKVYLQIFPFLKIKFRGFFQPRANTAQICYYSQARFKS